MAAERSLGLPIAIVMGSFVIGLFIYLGLRERPQAPSSTTTPAAASPSPAAAGKADAKAPPGEPVSTRVFRQAQAGLDAARPGLSQRCWTPPAAGEPPSITLDYDITFGPDGGIVM